MDRFVSVAKMKLLLCLPLFLFPLASAESYEEIRNLPGFVDKTGFIPLYFSGDTRPLVISAPSGFGKTANLLMLQSYLSKDSNPGRWESLFRATRIGRDLEKMRPNENATVLYCSFKQTQRLTDYESMLAGFREVLFRTFKSYSYLVKSRKLTRHDKKVMTVYAGVKKHLKMSRTHIILGLFYLSKLLRKHHERPVLLMIDDYDTFLLDSLSTKGLDERATLALHRTLLSAVLRNNPHVTRAILAGETALCARPIAADLGLVFADNRFSPYLGLTRCDLDELLKRENFKNFAGKRDTIRKWYGGYTSADTDLQVYHLQAVLGYLTSGQLRSYWTETRQTRMLRLLMIEPSVEQLLNDSIRYTPLEFGYVENVQDRHLEGIKTVCSTELWDEDFTDVFMMLLLETGYYTFTSRRDNSTRTVQVRIPNEQIRVVLNQICVSFLEDPLDLLERLKEAVHEAAFMDKSEKPPPEAEEVEELISIITKPGVKNKNLMRL